MTKTSKFLADSWNNLRPDQLPGFECPDWFYKAEKTMRKPFFGFGEKHDVDSEELLTPEKIQRIKEAIGMGSGIFGESANGEQQVNLHALAIYVPRAFSSDSTWGITVNENAVVEVAMLVAEHCAIRGHFLKFSSAYNAVLSFVLRHELTHHAVERFGAQAHLINGCAHYVTNFYAFCDVEEALCTSCEMSVDVLASMARTEPMQVRETITEVWKSIPLTHPYSEWQRYGHGSWQALEDLVLGMGERPESATLLDQAISDAYRLYREVPTRYLSTDISMLVRVSHVLARIVPLDPKKIRKHAQKVAKSGRIPGLLVVKGNRHPFTISRPNFTSVDIDPIKWDRADYHIVKQLAHIFSLEPATYISEVLTA